MMMMMISLLLLFCFFFVVVFLLVPLLQLCTGKGCLPALSDNLQVCDLHLSAWHG